MGDLRVAIIGYGFAGRVLHAPLICATPGLSLCSVVTGNAERRSTLARDHPAAQVLTTDELWARASEHDLVVVAAPNDAHCALAGAAIEHRLPVVVDKPLAITSGQAQALVEQARRAGVLLTVFQNRRWDSDQLTLARLLAEKRLGKVLRYESRFERWRPTPRPGAWRETVAPERGGGVLLDLGTHLVDQALARFGPATHVYAELDARRGLAAEDDAFVALRHAGGVLSHLHASALTAAPGPRLRVLGDRAAYLVTGLDGQEDALRAGARPETQPNWGSEPQSSWGSLVAGEETLVVPSERGNWPRFYALLARALREGEPPPVDPSDAVATLKVLEAARASAEANAVVATAADEPRR